MGSVARDCVIAAAPATLAIVQTQQLIAPTYAELRPYKPDTSAAFPVHPALTDTLATAGADDVIAHAMAVCSGYAYGDLETLATIMARMGLEQNHCLMVSEYVDALLITTASYLVQSQDGRVMILAYRGTPPTSVITWFTDLEIEPTRISLPTPYGAGEFDVHAGIYRNVRATRHVVVAALERAIEGYSVGLDGGKLENGLEALYITGHSLGGASAGMLAAMLQTDREDYGPIVERLKAVYTFGAPMFGSPEFAAACNHVDFLRERVLRYVYERDFAPQIPVKENGPYAHFGQELQYRRGSWHHNRHARRQQRNLLAVAAAPLSFVARQFPLTRHIPFPVSIYDHLPRNYIDALTPPGVRSEYGD